jgi:hypothetical protein
MNWVWPTSRSLATTREISFDLYSWRYWDVSLPVVCFLHLWIGCKIPVKVGFPIRKSPDQSVCATPRSLSQLTTSFIAFKCQGIHHIPLVALKRVSNLAKNQLKQSIYSNFKEQLNKYKKHKLLSWWAWDDLNIRPHAYQACALTNWATGPCL